MKLMKNVTLKQLVTASVAAVMVTASTASAWADGRGRGDYDRGGGYGERYKGGHGNYGRGDRDHRGGPKYNYGHNKPTYNYGHKYHGQRYGGWYPSPRYYGRPYNYYGHSHYHGRGNSGGYFVLGAATGLLLGTVMANSQSREREVVYSTNYVTPPPAYQGQYQTSSYQPLPDNCLQTREYTTTVIIGGREEEAYGTACLQNDGSWLQGPPQIAPR